MLPALNQSIVNESEHMYVYFQVGCRVVTQGPYWSVDCQGMQATVMEVRDSQTMTVRWEVEWCSKAGKLRRVWQLDHLQTVSSSPTRTWKTSVQIPLPLNFLVGDALSGFHL